MHLAIDAVGIREGGGAVVLLSLLDAAEELPHISRVTVFAAKRRLFTFPLLPKVTVREQARVSDSMPARVWWYAGGLARATRRMKADAVLCLGGGGFAHRNAVGGTLIQQSLPFSAEALARFGTVERMKFAAVRRAMRQSCSRSRHVFVQTATMRNAVQSAFGVPDARLHMVPPPPPALPAGPPSPRLAPMRSAKGFRFLMVGEPTPYKNIDAVVAGLQILRAIQPETRLFATCASHGAPGVVPLGRLERHELREAYKLAHALVMPSLVETVGFPMLEAAQLGVPILAADRPYAREICGTAAVFFDPLQAQSFALEAGELLDDEGWQARLVAQGKQRANHFAAQRSYHRMLELLVG